ncbi:MAG: hypothetical protein IKF52_04550 [Clostridia bacterium]|nr:hypothetical protein [Clostridia bacterium]
MKNKIIKRFLAVTLIQVFIVSLIHIWFIPSEVQALSGSYTQSVKSGISAFPESYQKQLAYLKYLHPNWEFKAYYTGIDWGEVTSGEAENQCLRNTIYKNYTIDPLALCICGRSGDANYYCGSAKVVNYYLDPRNFMGEAMVFEFLDLSNGSGVNRDVVASAVSGTFLEGYLDDIMAAANEAGVNPLHIVATIYQEIGRSGTPLAISGTFPGYEGLYNFYNYGATDGDGAISRGLAKARELGWTNPRYALVDGAKRVLANNYISVGQSTKYFYKFDVVGDEILKEDMGSRSYSLDNFYSHQYMTNLRDPASQAGSLYDIYAENGILDSKLTFTIPVYNNMPSSPCTAPTSLSGELYYIDSLKKYGVQFRESAGGDSLGNIYKDTRVQLLANEGYWSRVKIIRATSYNGSGWNAEEKIGYVASEYLTKVGTEIPDYRGSVDMGNSGNTSPQPTVVQSSEYKIEGLNIKMTPTVTANDIKSKNPTAVIKNTSGADISNSTELVGTGYTVTIDGTTYTVIKFGDLNGDGYVDTGDTLIAKQVVLGKRGIDGIYKTAMDVNKDSYTDTGDTLVLKKVILKVGNITL